MAQYRSAIYGQIARTVVHGDQHELHIADRFMQDAARVADHSVRRVRVNGSHDWIPEIGSFFVSAVLIAVERVGDVFATWLIKEIRVPASVSALSRVIEFHQVSDEIGVG